jgi:hypothetical protein
MDRVPKKSQQSEDRRATRKSTNIDDAFRLYLRLRDTDLDAFDAKDAEAIRRVTYRKIQRHLT